MNNEQCNDPRLFSLFDLSLKSQSNIPQLLPLPSIIPPPPSMAQYQKVDQNLAHQQFQTKLQPHGIHNNQRQPQHQNHIQQQQSSQYSQHTQHQQQTQNTPYPLQNPHLSQQQQQNPYIPQQQSLQQQKMIPQRQQPLQPNSQPPLSPVQQTQKQQQNQYQNQHLSQQHNQIKQIPRIKPDQTYQQLNSQNQSHHYINQTPQLSHEKIPSQQQRQQQQTVQLQQQMPIIQSEITQKPHKVQPQQYHNQMNNMSQKSIPNRQQNYNSFQSLSIPNLSTNNSRPPYTPSQPRPSQPYVRPPIYRPSLSRPPPPKLRNDPVLDSKEEISKWREQRLKRYPRQNRQVDLEEQNENELSKLELKLRKKVRILSGSSRRMQVKVKQMKDLCKQLTDGYKYTKKAPNPQKHIKLNKENKEEIQTPNDFNIDDFFNDGQHHQESPQLEGFGETADLGQEAMRSSMTEQEMREEITVIETKLRQQRPKEFFKNQREGQAPEQMNPSQKKKLKNRLKNLKHIVKPIIIEAVVTNEEHVKDMIEKLKIQRDNISQVLEQSLDYKSNPVNYRYKSNTLYASLVLDEIYKERSYILQAIRYIVKDNYFDPQCDQSVRETITPSESESDEQLISSISVSNQASESE